MATYKIIISITFSSLPFLQLQNVSEVDGQELKAVCFDLFVDNYVERVGKFKFAYLNFDLQFPKTRHVQIKQPATSPSECNDECGKQ